MEEKFSKYVDALCDEIVSRAKEVDDTVDTIFIGGGTPSLIPGELIGKIMETIYRSFKLVDNPEITIEANPGSATLEKLIAYKMLGINRLSMGVQSLDNDYLKLLGRVHTAEEAVETFEDARLAGFSNINVDLIFGLPGDDREAFRNTLEKVIKLKPEHISCYSLIVEEGTKLFEKIDKGVLENPNEDYDREDYHFAIKRLKEAGYFQYEISNFSRYGRYSRHNVRYWEQKEYLGFGIGATSFTLSKDFSEGRRFSNGDDINDYISGESALREDTKLSRKELMDEFMMLGFRKVCGPTLTDFDAQFGENPEVIYGEKLKKLTKNGLISKKEGCYELTEKGLDLANEIFLEFV